MNTNDVDVSAFRGVVSGERPVHGRDETVRRLEASNSGREWNAVCDEVKRANGDRYPDWWYEAVIASGLCDRKTGGIRVSVLR